MKSSMKNWRQNRMKQFWLHTLLRTYSSVMIIIIASFAILLSYADWDSREKEAQRVAQRVTARTVSEIEYYHRESTQIAQALVENQARIEGIYKYFSLSMPDYFYWQLERKASPYISVSLYENVDDLYVRNDFVTGVAIAFQDYKEVYVSTKDKRSGEKIRAEDFKPAGNSFAIPVSDPVSDQDLGVIYISLDPAVLYYAIDNTRGHTPMAVTVTSPFDTEIFHNPKSIAYGFKIDPELENMKIPKFTLQPLVENYFAHGVDHRRTDNVISIKALKQDGFVEILVVDNGRGMSAEKLANIREKLSQKYFEHQASYSDQRQSIGIVNVHERFVLYFGDRYAITIESAEQAGVQYRITIQDE